MMQTLKLGLEWFINPDHVPLYIARERGWLAEAGIALELVEPTDHLDAFEAIRSGALDLAVTEPLHLVADRAEGHDVVGLARFLHTHGGVMCLAASGIQRPRDLAGKRLQYPGAPGPGGLAIARSLIEADGGPADASIVPVNHGFRHTDALAEGHADAATLVFHNFEVLEAKSRGLEPRLFELSAWGVPDFCQLILITSPERLREKRAAMQALVRCLERAIVWLREHPSEARALYEQATGQSVSEGLGAAIFDATIACFTRDFDMSERYYGELADWMLRTGQIATRPEPASCWDPQLLRR